MSSESWKAAKSKVNCCIRRLLIEGNVEKIKFLGLGAEAHDDMCFYFHDCFALPEATRKPHYLLNAIQFSRSQAGIKPIRVNIDGVETELMANRSYCSGVKVCAGEGCTYTVSTKQRVN